MKDLVVVYQDTIEKSKQFPEGNTTKHTFSEVGPIGTVSQVLKNNGYSVIKVENSDTVTSLQKWASLGKTCVLNMASYKRPGGGVKNGARAQEECLFRCSNLGQSISSDFYPLEEDSCLYTQESTFFKDKDYEDMSPVICDVMTIAAINLNEQHQFYQYQKNSPYKETTLDKIRLMITIPAKMGVKNLILGAWGCGVFKNEPDRMAHFFKQVLIDEGFASFYDNVIFAIINDHNSRGSNYEVFSEILSSGI
jgi:uncharacterized protein (TIGR02452 family)